MIEVTSGKKPVAPEIGTTSVHLRSGNSDGFRCKRHQQKHLVFFPTYFASRGRGFESRHVHQLYFFNEVASMFSRFTTCYSIVGG